MHHPYLEKDQTQSSLTLVAFIGLTEDNEDTWTKAIASIIIERKATVSRHMKSFIDKVTKETAPMNFLTLSDDFY